MSGFGQNISWGNDGDVAAGHKLSFKETMQIMSKDFFIPIVVPKWASGITKRTQLAAQALVELRVRCSKLVLVSLGSLTLTTHPAELSFGDDSSPPSLGKS